MLLDDNRRLRIIDGATHSKPIGASLWENVRYEPYSEELELAYMRMRTQRALSKFITPAFICSLDDDNLALLSRTIQEIQNNHKP